MNDRLTDRYRHTHKYTQSDDNEGDNKLVWSTSGVTICQRRTKVLGEKHTPVLLLSITKSMWVALGLVEGLHIENMPSNSLSCDMTLCVHLAELSLQ
jgi:hypothetical protein